MLVEELEVEPDRAKDLLVGLRPAEPPVPLLDKPSTDAVAIYRRVAATLRGRPDHDRRRVAGTSGLRPCCGTIASVAYDEELAAGIRAELGGQPDVTEMKMFGGLAFLVGGNMAVAASGQGGLLVRVDPEKSGKLVASGKSVPMEMRGREMRGWLRVDAAHVHTRSDLVKWIQLGTTYARSLPTKQR